VVPAASLTHSQRDRLTGSRRDQQLYTLFRALGTPLADPPFFQLPISLHDLPQRYSLM